MYGRVCYYKEVLQTAVKLKEVLSWVEGEAKPLDFTDELLQLEVYWAVHAIVSCEGQLILLCQTESTVVSVVRSVRKLACRLVAN
jgi:hypothetical protein